MAKNTAEKQLAEKILHSMYHPNGRGKSHSFMFGKPDCPHWEKRSGTELYYDQDKLLEASFFLRENGASYLKRIPIRIIESKLTNIVSESYGIWSNETYFKKFECSYFEFVSEASVLSFAQTLAHSELFKPDDILVVFPIQIVSVDNEFNSEHFHLIQPKSLLSIKQPVDVSQFDVCPEKFPPSVRLSNRFYDFKSWLCITAPNIESAQKKKAAILGALSLKYKSHLRHQFNMVKLVGGYCSFGKSMSNTIGKPHTPSIHQPLTITDNDFPFLNKLNNLFSSDSREEFRKIRALEYFYRAWFLDESERFPFLFMSLESLYGDGVNASQSIVYGVKESVGTEISEARLKILIGLRASIVHGGAPEIYDSKKYAQYYKKYKVCPSKDLNILVAACINKSVFENKVFAQSDKYQATIDKGRSQGKIPNFHDYNILNNKGTK